VNFTDAFAYVVGVEGKLSVDPQDPGNWTGGRVGVGELKGTKYGVSAAAYPLLDIANLQVSDAQTLAKREYWDKIGGDSLPYGIALLLFDFGYNTGIEEAVRVAQRALEIVVDGVLGPQTLGTMRNCNVRAFAIAFTAHRIVAYSAMALWQHDGLGWTARALKSMQQAVA
jgi:lysozyme family protein